jgi:hypothetical protein
VDRVRSNAEARGVEKKGWDGSGDEREGRVKRGTRKDTHQKA